MDEKNNLLKNFLVYGIVLLGGLYILSLAVFHTSFSDLLGYQFGIEWFLLKVAVISLVCWAAVAWVIRKLWVAARGTDGRSLWVYPAIASIVLVSLLLWLLTFIANSGAPFD